MVTATQRVTLQSKRIARLGREIIQLQQLLQITSDQRDSVMAEYACVAEMAIQVAAVATRDAANPDEYIVPAGALDALMFALQGE